MSAQLAYSKVAGWESKIRAPAGAGRCPENRAWAVEYRDYLRRNYLESEIVGPATDQFEMASRASRCRKIGLFTSILGGTIGDVSVWLGRSLTHLEELFSEAAEPTYFPVSELQGSEPQALRTTDNSLRNPFRGRQAMQLGWLLGEQDRACRLALRAPRIFDPQWGSAESEAGFEADFQLGRACSFLTLGLDYPAAEALDKLAQVAGGNVPWESTFARALISQSGNAYKYYLGEHLDWRKQETAKPEDAAYSELFLALSALSFSALALRRGIVKLNDLPDTGDHPLALLAGNLPGGGHART